MNISVQNVAAIIAIIAIIGALFALLRWVGKLERNTEATQELTRVLQGTSDKVQSHEVLLENHEVRIGALEEKVKK
jgi:hypothetical protein